MPDTPDPCAGKADGGICLGGVTIAPSSTPTSGSYYLVVNFDTNPPTSQWANAASPSPAVPKKSLPPKKKSPRK